MLCPKCQAQLKAECQDCPECGTRLGCSRSMSTVFKFILFLTALLGVFFAFSYFLSSELTKTVQDHLKALKGNELTKAYYAYTSRQFQEQTPLEQFKEFVNAYPILQNHLKAQYGEAIMEDDRGEVIAKLFGDAIDSTTDIAFYLNKEDNDWKIFGFELIDPKNEYSAPSENPDLRSIQPIDYKGNQSREILQLVQEFLELIRQKAYDKAYAEYASTGFKRSLTLEKFENFFKQYPEFAQSHSSHFDKLVFTNQTVAFEGTLKLSDTQEMPVEFDLTQEEGKWKIVHIYALPLVDLSKAKENLSVGVNPSGLMEFSKAVFGTQVDSSGNILDPSTHFKPNSADMYVQLFIKNGFAGNQLVLILKHLESDSSMAPVKATSVESGDDVLSFIFSPPTEGWTNGNYQLQVSASETSNTFTFQVSE